MTNTKQFPEPDYDSMVGMGSRPAMERELAEHRAALRSRGRADPRASEAAALRAAGGRSGVWDEMAASAAAAASEPAELDAHSFAASQARAAAAQARTTARSFAACRGDRVTVRPGVVPARGQWERLIARAAAEQAHCVVGEREHAFAHVDPDSVEAENRALGTPDAVSLGTYRPHR